MMKLRFSEVATAVGITPKSLRNWLQREQVDLKSVTPAGREWRDFDLGDLPHLAVIRTIVDFGIQVRTANDLARTLLSDGDIWDVSYDGRTRVSDIEAALFFREGQPLCVPIRSDEEMQTVMAENDAVLVIRLGRIIETTLQRALGGELAKELRVEVDWGKNSVG